MIQINASVNVFPTGVSSVKFSSFTASTNRSWTCLYAADGSAHATIAGIINSAYVSTTKDSSKLTYFGYAPTVSGYTFKGYSYSVYVGTTLLRSGTTTSPSFIVATSSEIKNASSNINMDIRAKWEKDATTTPSTPSTPTTPDYRFYYYANNGTGNSMQVASSVKTLYSAQNLNWDYPGYTFMGWSTNSTATTVQYRAGDVVNLTSNLYLYAVWSRNSSSGGSSGGSTGTTYCLIYYHANDGTSDSYSDGGLPGERKLIYAAKDFGWYDTDYRQFAGWASNVGATVPYAYAGNYVTLAAERLDLYAIWSKPATSKYTVKYAANDGTNYTQNIEVDANTYHSLYYASNLGWYNNTTREFLGWSTSSTATSPAYTGGQSVYISGNVTLYAVWKPIAKSYTLTYWANNGTTSNGGRTYKENETFAIANAADFGWSYGGYMFVGWSTTATGDVEYYPGRNVQLTGNASLYAVWSPISYYLEYQANNNTNTTKKEYGNAGTSKSLYYISDLGWTYSGYRFLGWSENKSATAASYGGGERFTLNRNTILYAVWEKIVVAPDPPPQPQVEYVKVIFNADGGYCATTSQEYIVGQSYGWLPTPSREGYKFEYWANGTSRVSTTTVAQKSVTYLRAVWTELPPTYVTCQVTYEGNGGTVYGSNTYQLNYTGGKTFAEQSGMPTPTRSGYSFNGWFTTSSGGTLYTPSSSVPNQPSFRLYAQWTQSMATITFNSNGGSSVNTTQYPLNQPYTYLPQPYRNGGYTFAGWYTSTAWTTKVTESSVCNGSRTLYAKWDPPNLDAPRVSATPNLVKRGGTYRVTISSVYNATSYRLRQRLNDGSWQTIEVGTTLTKDFTAPSDFIKAEYQAQAYMSDATSAWSDVVTVNVDRGLSPTDPVNIFIIPIGQQATSSSETGGSTGVPSTAPTIFPNGKLKTYEVAWGLSTDVDNDLAGYELEWRIQNGSTYGAWQSRGKFPVSVRTKLYDNSEIPAGTTQLQYRVRAYDSFDNQSNWVTATAEVFWYTPPQAPPWIKVPDPETDTINSANNFKVSWGPSVDVDNDVVSYQVERAVNDEPFVGSPLKVVSASTLYLYDNLNAEVKKVRYRVKAIDAQGLESEYTTSTWKTAFRNTAPTPPLDIKAIEPVKGGEYLRVYWGESQDAENNLAGYEVEYTIDGGKWTTLVASTPNLSYDQLVIPKTPTERHDTIAFRVRAFDSYGLKSGWTYGQTYNISNNASPVVTADYTNGSYLGQKEEGFSFGFQVTDEENDPVRIEIWIGNVLVYEADNVQTPFADICRISDNQFLKLPAGMQQILIQAKDAEGLGAWSSTFFRVGTYANITLKDPLSYPDPITTVTFTRIEGHIPDDAIVTVEVTNNAKEGELRTKWEECTLEARAHESYQFLNKGQLYGWAFNFRISLRRGPSGEGGYLTRVSGYFNAPDDVTVPFGN